MEFQKRLNELMQAIGPETFSYRKEDAEVYGELYASIEQYVMEKELLNTAISLPLMRGMLLGDAGAKIGWKEQDTPHLNYYKHCMSICRMLIDLHVPITKEEEDLILAAAICHVLPKKIAFPEKGRELVTTYHLDPQVYEILEINNRRAFHTEDEVREFYANIEKNKLALLVKLVDRGNLVEQLYDLAIWDARRYIRETRNYFFPMCIYAKEHYPELTPMISILMEKMRSLIEVADILSSRYEIRETALSNEILSLHEENARIRGIIHQLEVENGK